MNTMTQKGWVEDTTTNAEWRVRPVWPLKLPYFVRELDDDYSNTAIATDIYDYFWIMAREPELDADLLESVVDRMVTRGFRREDIRMMEQGGPEHE